MLLPWLETAHATLYHGDSTEVLRQLPDESVHAFVMSPPYYGLRDYEVEGQMGLEETPALYIAKLVTMFEEVRRVLRKDGCIWVNMGDSFAGSGRGGYPGGKSGLQGSTAGQDLARTAKETMWPAFRDGSMGRHWVPPPVGFKSKDMMGMPWRLAFALQDAGWYLRSEVIWWKKSAMPESCLDRPSKAHEHVFLLSKSPKYYYDKMGARELCTGNAHGRGRGINQKAKAGEKVTVVKNRQNESFSGSVTEVTTHRNQRTVWPLASYALKARHFAAFPPELVRRCLLSSPIEAGCCPECGAAWARIFHKTRVPTRPGTKSKASNWATGKGAHRTLGHNTSDGEHPKLKPGVQGNRDPQRHVTEFTTLGWWPRCKCYGVVPARRSNQEDVRTPQFDPSFAAQHVRAPCVVADFFHGAGTTWKTCERLGANYIGCDIREEYLQLSVERPAVKFEHEKPVRKRRRKRHPVEMPLFPEEDGYDVPPMPRRADHQKGRYVWD